MDYVAKLARKTLSECSAAVVVRDDPQKLGRLNVEAEDVVVDAEVSLEAADDVFCQNRAS